MNLSVDVTSLKSSRGEKFDLTNPKDRDHIINNGLELDIRNHTILEVMHGEELV